MAFECAIELAYKDTPMTIVSLCRKWKEPDLSLMSFLHGAVMFLDFRMKLYDEVESELVFLHKLVSIR